MGAFVSCLKCLLPVLVDPVQFASVPVPAVPGQDLLYLYRGGERAHVREVQGGDTLSRVAGPRGSGR